MSKPQRYFTIGLHKKKQAARNSDSSDYLKKKKKKRTFSEKYPGMTHGAPSGGAGPE